MIHEMIHANDDFSHVLAYIFSKNGPSLHAFTALTVNFRFKAGKLASTRVPVCGIHGEDIFLP